MAETARKTNLSQARDETAEDPIVDTWHGTIAGVLGNTLEWYDFALFGYFSGTFNSDYFKAVVDFNLPDSPFVFCNC